MWVCLAGSVQQRLCQVVQCLLPIWQAKGRTVRLATPLLKTADALFSQGGLHSLQDPVLGANAAPSGLCCLAAAMHAFCACCAFWPTRCLQPMQICPPGDASPVARV